MLSQGKLTENCNWFSLITIFCLFWMSFSYLINFNPNDFVMIHNSDIKFVTKKKFNSYQFGGIIFGMNFFRKIFWFGEVFINIKDKIR